MGLFRMYMLFSVATFAATLVTAHRSAHGSSAMMGRYILTSKLSTLLMLNICLCAVICLGRMVTWVFLVELRELERKKLLERLTNYLLFKLFFVAAMLEHGVGSVAMWVGWITFAAFFKSFGLLGRERMEHLLNVSESSTFRVGLLLTGVLSVVSIVSASLCTLGSLSWSLTLLLLVDCANVIIDCLHGFGKLAVAAHDARLNGDWEDRVYYSYLVEVLSEVAFLVASLLHYSHLLYILGISFTLIDVILLLNMRTVVQSLMRKFYNYRTFVAMQSELRDRYPTVEPGPDQVCAICRDSMENGAKELPCGHLYHLRCIRSWIEQNQNSCPMCRYDLSKDRSPEAEAPANRGLFDWLAPLLGAPRAPRPEEIDRVAEMFPNLPRQVIANDLATTGAAELTIERIIEGRLGGMEERFPEPAEQIQQEVQEEAIQEEEIQEEAAPVWNQEIPEFEEMEEMEEMEEEASVEELVQENLEEEGEEFSPDAIRQLALEAALKRSREAIQ